MKVGHAALSNTRSICGEGRRCSGTKPILFRQCLNPKQNNAGINPVPMVKANRFDAETERFLLLDGK